MECQMKAIIYVTNIHVSVAQRNHNNYLNKKLQNENNIY